MRSRPLRILASAGSDTPICTRISSPTVAGRRGAAAAARAAAALGRGGGLEPERLLHLAGGGGGERALERRGGGAGGGGRRGGGGGRGRRLGDVGERTAAGGAGRGDEDSQHWARLLGARPRRRLRVLTHTSPGRAKRLRPGRSAPLDRSAGVVDFSSAAHHASCCCYLHNGSIHVRYGVV